MTCERRKEGKRGPGPTRGGSRIPKKTMGSLPSDPDTQKNEGVKAEGKGKKSKKERLLRREERAADWDSPVPKKLLTAKERREKDTYTKTKTGS